MPQRPDRDCRGGLWSHLAGAARNGQAIHCSPPSGPRILFDEILDEAARLSRAIPRRTTHQPRVGVLMENGPKWIVAFLAAIRAGATVVPLPVPAFSSATRPGIDRLRAIAQAAALEVVVVDDAAERIARDVGEHVGIDVLNVERSRPVAAEVPGPEPDSEAVAVIQYTSGSTSDPKGIPLTHANVLAGLRPLSADLAWRAEDVPAIVVPLFHAIGLFTMLASLANGSSLCLWPPREFARDPLGVLGAISQEPVTVIRAPNFVYDHLTRVFRRSPQTGFDLSRLRLALNGGEPVQRGTVDAFTTTFEQLGLRPDIVTPVYGLAEATLSVTVGDIQRPPRFQAVDRGSVASGERVKATSEETDSRIVASVGRSVTGIELRIALESNVLDEGCAGEVQIRGPAVMTGYLNTPVDAQPFTADGWLRTGDLGFLLGGELFVAGRLKDVAVINGKNYYAEDVEELAIRAACGTVARCAAFAATDGDSDRIVVVVEMSRSSARRTRTLQRAIAASLGLGAVEVVAVEPGAVPVTSSGKLRRNAARRAWQASSWESTE